MLAWIPEDCIKIIQCLATTKELRLATPWMVEARCHGASGVINIDSTTWSGSSLLEGNDTRNFVELGLGEAMVFRHVTNGVKVEHAHNGSPIGTVITGNAEVVAAGAASVNSCRSRC